MKTQSEIVAEWSASDGHRHRKVQFTVTNIRDETKLMEAIYEEIRPNWWQLKPGSLKEVIS